MKKKGFTLIELLAVIVILALIALIATPIIVGVIGDAKKNAFKDTAYGIIEAGRLYYAGEFGNDSFDGKTFDFTGNVAELKLSGEKPAGGNLVISKDGKYGLAVYNKDKSLCAIKEYDKEEIQVSAYKKEDCVVPEEIGGGVKTIIDKNTDGNNEGLYTDQFGNIRYRGKTEEVKNYVMFNGELWRIIGVFDGKIKIIRNEKLPNTEDAEHPDGFEWDNKPTNVDENTYPGDNDWSTAELQKYLNGTYYNSLTATSKNMIAEVTYPLGGITSTTTYDGGTYQLERGTTVYEGRPTSWTGKIGLMYLSDYEYSPSKECVANLYYYYWPECSVDNWLFFDGSSKWTMTTNSDAPRGVGYISSMGNGSYEVPGDTWLAVYPVVHLKSNVQIASGDGTSGNPYILK